MFHMSLITKNDVGGGWWRITAYLRGVMVFPLHVRLIIIHGGLSNLSPCFPTLVEERLDGVGGRRVDASLRRLYGCAVGSIVGSDQIQWGEVAPLRGGLQHHYSPRVCGCHS